MGVERWCGVAPTSRGGGGYISRAWQYDTVYFAANTYQRLAPAWILSPDNFAQNSVARLGGRRPAGGRAPLTARNNVRQKPTIRQSEYTTGEHRIVNGRPHGFLWRRRWQVEFEFDSEEKARAFADSCDVEEFGEGPVADAPVITRRWSK